MYQKHVEDLHYLSQEMLHTHLRPGNTIKPAIVSLLGNSSQHSLSALSPGLKPNQQSSYKDCSCSVFPREALLILETNNKDLEKSTFTYFFH